MKKTIKLIAVLATVLSSLSMAQTPFRAGGNFTVGVPQNEFKDNVDNVGFGGTGYFGYNFPRTPFIVGISGSFLIYGSETREEPFSTTIPDVTVDVTTTNSIVSGHLFLRVQPSDGFLRPYLDGLIGFNYLFTETQIKNQHAPDGHDEVASSTNFDDFASSYGGGGGLMIRVWHNTDNDEAEGNKLSAVFVDLGLHYLKGGEAEYLKEGSIARENGKVVYDVSKSTTDLTNVHVGVSFAF